LPQIKIVVPGADGTCPTQLRMACHAVWVKPYQSIMCHVLIILVKNGWLEEPKIGVITSDWDG
jgi:hypothetical protein